MSEMQNAQSATGFSVWMIKLLFLNQCLILLGRGRVLKQSAVATFENHRCNRKQRKISIPIITYCNLQDSISNPSSETYAQINDIIIIAHMYTFHSDWADNKWFLLWI